MFSWRCFFGIAWFEIVFDLLHFRIFNAIIVLQVINVHHRTITAYCCWHILQYLDLIFQFDFNPRALSFFCVVAVNIEVIIIEATDLKNVSIFYGYQGGVQFSYWNLWYVLPSIIEYIVLKTRFASHWNTSHTHRVHHLFNTTCYINVIFHHYCSVCKPRFWHWFSYYGCLFFQINLQILRTDFVILNPKSTYNKAIVSVWVAHYYTRPINS